MLKRFLRHGAVQAGVGWLLSLYLRFVRATNRLEFDPPDFYAKLDRDGAGIFALWHGQNFMLPLAHRRGLRFAVLISRHGDAGVVAAASVAMGLEPIRASGGGRKQGDKKGGAAGLRAMLTALKEGASVVLTPDVPKVARIAGPGIIALAKLSGRPIYPIVVATSRRIDLKNWDRTPICLPFGHGIVMLGDAIHVARDADDAALEAARLQLQVRLDEVHRRAYAYLGVADPGAAARSQRA